MAQAPLRVVRMSKGPRRLVVRREIRAELIERDSVEFHRERLARSDLAGVHVEEVSGAPFAGGARADADDLPILRKFRPPLSAIRAKFSQNGKIVRVSTGTAS